MPKPAARWRARSRRTPTGSFDDAYAFRMLGGVHRLVLDGRAEALAAHYPSVGGDGDAVAAGARG